MSNCRRSGTSALRGGGDTAAPSRMRARAGLTLIELLLVTMILSVLAIVAAGPVIKARERAKTTAARADLSRAIRAVEFYQAINHGQMPAGIGDLASVDYAPSPQILVCRFERNDAPVAGDRFVVIDMKHRGSDRGVTTQHPTWSGNIVDAQLPGCTAGDGDSDAGSAGEAEGEDAADDGITGGGGNTGGGNSLNKGKKGNPR